MHCVADVTVIIIIVTRRFRVYNVFVFKIIFIFFLRRALNASQIKLLKIRSGGNQTKVCPKHCTTTNGFTADKTPSTSKKAVNIKKMIVRNGKKLDNNEKKNFKRKMHFKVIHTIPYYFAECMKTKNRN